MAIDDLFADPEAQACSGETFRCEERIEEFRTCVADHTDSGVRDCDDYSGLAVLPIRSETGSQVQHATLCAHCVESVADQVADDLADLALEATNGHKSTLPFHDAHTGIQYFPVVDRQDSLDELFRGDRLRAGCLLVKTQCLTGDGRDPAQLNFRSLQKLMDRVDVFAVLSEVKKIGNRFQRVVDLVGNGAGKASNQPRAFHFE